MTLVATGFHCAAIAQDDNLSSADDASTEVRVIEEILVTAKRAAERLRRNG
jgi:hypothetical protein